MLWSSSSDSLCPTESLSLMSRIQSLSAPLRVSIAWTAISGCSLLTGGDRASSSKSYFNAESSSDIVSDLSLSKTMPFSSSKQFGSLYLRDLVVTVRGGASDLAFCNLAYRCRSLTVRPSCFGGLPLFFGGASGSRLEWLRPRLLLVRPACISWLSSAPNSSSSGG